jgi:hypothetical protein
MGKAKAAPKKASGVAAAQKAEAGKKAKAAQKKAVSESEVRQTASPTAEHAYACRFAYACCTPPAIGGVRCILLSYNMRELEYRGFGHAIAAGRRANLRRQASRFPRMSPSPLLPLFAAAGQLVRRRLFF